MYTASAAHACDRPSRLATLSARATWLALPITFIGLLGGLHPSDGARDNIVRLTFILVIALNGPVTLWVFRPTARRSLY
ncbi:MAG: hypothetical protein NVSMB1_13000 [Polyangiales bacterium]